MKNKYSIKKTALLARLLLLLLASAFILPFSACGKKKATDNADPNDNTSIIAKIGDESISMALYKAAFDSYAEYWSQMGFDPFAAESDLENLQDVVLDALLNDIVVLHHAKKEGTELTEDELNAVDKEFEEAFASLEKDYMALAEEEYKKDSSLTVEQHYVKLIGELSEYYTGKVMTVEEYMAEYKNELINEKLIGKYKEKVISEFNVTDEDIIEWYSKQFEVDKSLYSEKPEQFKEDTDYFDIFRGIKADAYPTTYAPEGYSRIMDIVVRPEGQLSEEYTKKYEELSSIGQECAALLFSDALDGNNTNRVRIDELLTKYRSLEKEIDAMYEEFIAPAKKKLEAAEAELKAGANFAEVMLKYTENTYITGDSDYPGSSVWREQGQLIALDLECGTADWSKTVKDIYGILKEGEYSTVFSDEDGSLHIIYRCGAVEPGQVDISGVKDDIAFILKTEKGAKDWEELVKAWTGDSELEVNRESIRAVGRDKLKTK